MATPQWRIALRSDVDACRQLDLPAAVEISLIFGNPCTHLFDDRLEARIDHSCTFPMAT